MIHAVTFRKSGRGKAQCEPNPLYPDGIDVNTDQPEPLCLVKLPYPAPECGYWFIKCATCGFTAAITAAGRVDDPRSVKLPCAISGTKQ